MPDTPGTPDIGTSANTGTSPDTGSTPDNVTAPVPANSSRSLPNLAGAGIPNLPAGPPLPVGPGAPKTPVDPAPITELAGADKTSSGTGDVETTSCKLRAFQTFNAFLILSF
jgi:hypothetical protein